MQNGAICITCGAVKAPSASGTKLSLGAYQKLAEAGSGYTLFGEPTGTPHTLTEVLSAWKASS